MIENIAILIVKDLGSTGILLIGLYFILMKVGQMIATHLHVINHNTTNISNSLKCITQLYKLKQNGEI